MIKENDITFKIARCRLYHAETMTDTDLPDVAFLANTPDQVESQLHCLEQAAGGISLYVNTDKT